MIHNKSIKSETTHNGTLNTPVSFYKMAPDEDNFYGDELVVSKIFETMAEVYNPSQKDVSIMQSKGIKNAITIKIRNPLTGYIVSNDHKATINSLEFADKTWNIADIRPDIIDKRYLTILLDGGSDSVRY